MSNTGFILPYQSSSLQGDYGVKKLAPGDCPLVDIVALHGLNGHYELSWTHEKSNILWLRDLLPKAIPRARILTYGYDGNTHGRPQLSYQTIYDLSETFIAKLVMFRKATRTLKRPIIFIAHSLGGIILKSVCMHPVEHNSYN
ncbi:hypothetical protein BU17DRAFT_48526 [Hysterangium stoloniferum]|nr:hypothetical protein BU17DRAFT_48526 [Hysterangium stoloniferum]